MGLQPSTTPKKGLFLFCYHDIVVRVNQPLEGIPLMSKLRTTFKVVATLGALYGTARYLSKPENRETLRNGAVFVGNKVAAVAGKVVAVAANTKDRAAARVG